MELRIERDALDLVFRTLLTCECPVTDAEERAIYDLLKVTPAAGTIDYSLVLAVFKPNANTVFGRLREFTIWQAPADADQYSIGREHVVRHFASSFHWNHVVASGLEGAYKKVLHIPSWFLGHMLLPVKVTSVDGDVVSAYYEYDGGKVHLSNLFAPKDYAPRPDETWAVHFAGLLDRLNPTEMEVVRLMTETNHLLVQFRRDVSIIDYANFERHGNYLALCRRRYEKYYG
jgi:hypothetical protein